VVDDSCPLSLDQGALPWSQGCEGVAYMVEGEKTSSVQDNSPRQICVKRVLLNMMKMKLHGGHSFGGASRLAVQRLLKWERR